MKTIFKLVCVLLAVTMLFAVSACGGGDTTTSSAEPSSVSDVSRDPNATASIPNIEDFSGTVSINPSDSLSADKETGVRYDKDYNLLYKPEDVGELSNPIVKGLVSPAPDDEWYAQEIGWKEEAYGIEYDMDTCAWGEREMKWVAAFVGGSSYDVLTRVNFPTVVVKGLLEPLDEYLPIGDERYFAQQYVWGDHVYGMQAKATNYYYRDCGELYGVWYNADLFDENGLTSPLELWENGEWTFDALVEAAEKLTLDNDRDGVIDVYGWGTHKKDMFTIGNGAKTVEFSDGKIDLIWNDPAYIRGLEYIIEIAPYTNASSSYSFAEGKLAMYGERIQNSRKFSKTSPEYNLNFEAVWVPFPKGPDGEGYAGSISTGAETVSIGKGAKNIEGAKVWICADICKFDYVSPEGATMMMGVDDTTLQRALSCEPHIIKDCFASIGNLQNQMYQVWDSMAQLGAKAAIEKYTPTFQEQIDIVLQDTNVE